MLRAFGSALQDIGQRDSIRTLGIAALGGIVVSASLFALAAWAFQATTLIEWDWAEAALDLLGSIGALAITILMFPLVVTIIGGAFIEDLATKTERRRYPSMGPPGDGQSFLQAVSGGLRFLGLALTVNLLLLLLTLVLPGLNLILALIFNGYLLAREYADTIAARRINQTAIKQWRRANRAGLVLLGIGLALLFAIPLVNLAAPVLATLIVTHWLAQQSAYRTEGGHMVKSTMPAS